MSIILTISILITLVVIVFVGMYYINQAIIRHEQIECQEWLWKAATYSGWYWTSWQVDQCVAVEMYPI